MKLAKYVVIGQMTLSAILLGVFVTRSGASSQPGHGADPAADRADDSHAGDPHAAKPAVPAAKAKKAKPKGPRNEAELEWKAGQAGIPDDEAADAHGAASAADHGAAAGAHGAPGAVTSPAAAAPKATNTRVVPPPANLATDPKVVARVLLEGNGRFAEGRRSGYNLIEQREGSAGGEHPGVMVLGCSDSRVPPELIFDRGVGEMFVVRSAGNIAEPVAVGSLEYGAEHLQAKVLLVLGHEKCGAVVAALSEAKMPSVNLEAVMGSILPAVKELKGWAEGDQLIHLAVEANVRRQAEEVLKRSTILRDMVQRKALTLLKGVYDLQSGLVRPL